MPVIASNHDTELDFILSDLGFLLRRESDRWVQQASLGLTRAQWLGLDQVALQEGCLQREPTETIHIEASTVGRHVERLVTAGRLARRDDALDGRAYRPHLQPKARSTRLLLQRLTDQLRDEYFAGISPERRKELVDDLGLIRRDLLASPARTEGLPSVHAISHEFQPVR
jgi:DNA-binding MarR family transcriptional regulator